MTQKQIQIFYLPTAQTKLRNHMINFFEAIRCANSNSEHNISENHSVSIIKDDETKLDSCNDYELSWQIVSENFITFSYCD